MPEGTPNQSERLLQLYLDSTSADNYEALEPYVGEHCALGLENRLKRASTVKDPLEKYELMHSIVRQIRSVMAFNIGKELGPDNIARDLKLDVYTTLGNRYLDDKLNVKRE